MKRRQHPSHEKAQSGQTRVRSWLEENGFVVAEVKGVTANGIDILAIKNGTGISVEVKTVIRSRGVNRVTKPHPKSDYVAVVMPSGYIHVEPTADWLRSCQKDGSRSIGKLVNFCELLRAETK